ncbi:MAG: NAD(P)H-dependent oxidoreductase [Xanthomonadales bacterium]|nr:NAD(P)H-dependent oxidoreductase [Xanthomonadales bacterium]
MKITAIIGSLRQNSIHRGIFESYKELAKEFFTLEEGVIRNIPLYNEDDGDNDIVHQLAEQIYHSDGVIFFCS